ncbi:hypothetical protein BJ912DRAFT_955435 [Pholiota molesta]|nr:hypothetical protein BJ912DRAFT_955435 [Pholiota molesta]
MLRAISVGFVVNFDLRCVITLLFFFLVRHHDHIYSHFLHTSPLQSLVQCCTFTTTWIFSLFFCFECARMYIYGSRFGNGDTFTPPVAS